jgi:hypothetical protein
MRQKYIPFLSTVYVLALQNISGLRHAGELWVFCLKDLGHENHVEVKIFKNIKTLVTHNDLFWPI